jgi:signal peptidase I
MNNNKDMPQNSTKALKGFYEILEMIVMAAAITVLVFMFLGRLTVVDGDSMNYTLIDKEVLVVSDFAYTPERGDIVVFQAPGTAITANAIVKRVIATEGQTVDIDFNNWIVYVDGEPLYKDDNGNPMREPYINDEQFEAYGIPMRRGNVYGYDSVEYPYVVPEGKVFLMGDNRNNSRDSREIGAVDTRFIFGKVILRLAPISKFGFVD